MSEKAWAVYIRRCCKKEGDADVSDETQEAVARSRIPEGAAVAIYSDCGGHNSGYTTDRPAYQRMLADLRADRLAGISAYNQSRLNRSAENDLGLLRECATHGVRLSVGEGEQDHGTASGKLTYGINAVVSQNYRDLMSDTVSAMMRRTFEDGGHRGKDPFGYETARDDRYRVCTRGNSWSCRRRPRSSAACSRCWSPTPSPRRRPSSTPRASGTAPTDRGATRP